MSDGLDVGTLTGRIELEDRLSNVLEQVGGAIGKFESSFKSAGATILEQATGFFTAEAALHAVEGAAHLAAQTLKELFIEGSKEADIRHSFEHLTEAAGQYADVLLNRVRAGSHGLIEDTDIMRRINENMAAGLKLSADQMGMLSEGAYRLAKATGIDAKDALDRLSDAMLTGRTRSVAMLTGKIDLAAAEDRYAAKLGTTSDRLTEAEKLEATRVAILERVAGASQRLGEQTLSLADRVGQAEIAFKNFMSDLGESVAQSPVILTAFDDIKNALTEAFGGQQQNLIKKITEYIDEAAIQALKFAETATDVAGVIGMEWNAAKVVFKDIEQIIGGDVLVFKYLAEGVAEVGKALHLPGAAEDVERIDNDIQHLMETMTARGKALQEDKAAEEQWASVTGQVKDKIEEIRKHLESVKEAQRDHREETDKITEAQNKAKEAIGGASDAIATEGNNSRMTKEEIKKFNEAMNEINNVGKDWHETLNTISGDVAESVKYYLEAGVAAEKLATVYGLTAAQVAAVSKELEQEKANWKVEEQSLTQTTELWNEYYRLRVEHGGTTLQLQKKQIEEWFENEVAKLKDNDENWRAHYEALEAVAKEKLNAVSVDWDNLNNHSKQTLDDQAAKAKATYEYALQHADQFSAGFIAQLKKTAEATKETAAHWREDLGGALEHVEEKVKALSGEMETLEERSKRQSGGGTFEINRGNLAENARTWGIPEDVAFSAAQRGFSFQEILQAWQTHMMDSWVPRGPRIPGFKEGGIGDFGEGTLAMLHGKEIIAPLDKVGSIGGVNVTIHVNGTAADVARKVADELVRTLKYTRQFGAA